MPFARPTLPDLVGRTEADIEARLPGADARLPVSVLGVLARVLAGAMHGLYGYLDWIARQILVDLADAELLDRHGRIWGVTRKPATFSAGLLSFAGTDGAIIPAGTVVRRADGVEYATSEPAIIAGGVAAVAAAALVEGAAGDASAGVPVSVVSPLAGVQSTTAIGAGGMSGGADQEGDADYRSRILARIQAPPHGGNRTDYIAWAREVAGVTRAWVWAGVNGPGTVVVRFMMDDARPLGIPLAGDVAAVQAYIDERRPVTASVLVAAPVPMAQAFSVRVFPATAAVKAAITAELGDLIRREAEPGGTLLLSRMREAISLAAGETDHTLVSPSTDVTLPADQIAVMGAITWTT